MTWNQPRSVPTASARASSVGSIGNRRPRSTVAEIGLRDAGALRRLGPPDRGSDPPALVRALGRLLGSPQQAAECPHTLRPPTTSAVARSGSPARLGGSVACAGTRRHPGESSLLGLQVSVIGFVPVLAAVFVGFFGIGGHELSKPALVPLAWSASRSTHDSARCGFCATMHAWNAYSEESVDPPPSHWSSVCWRSSQVWAWSCCSVPLTRRTRDTVRPLCTRAPLRPE